jgi:hypothetical protein
MSWARAVSVCRQICVARARSLCQVGPGDQCFLQPPAPVRREVRRPDHMDLAGRFNHPSESPRRRVLRGPNFPLLSAITSRLSPSLTQREVREERNRAENAAATSRRHYRSGSVNWVGGASADPWEGWDSVTVVEGSAGFPELLTSACRSPPTAARRGQDCLCYQPPVRYPSPDSQSALL